MVYTAFNIWLYTYSSDLALLFLQLPLFVFPLDEFTTRWRKKITRSAALRVIMFQSCKPIDWKSDTTQQGLCSSHIGRFSVCSLNLYVFSSRMDCQAAYSRYQVRTVYCIDTQGTIFVWFLITCLKSILFSHFFPILVSFHAYTSHAYLKEKSGEIGENLPVAIRILVRSAMGIATLKLWEEGVTNLRPRILFNIRLKSPSPRKYPF